MTNNEINPFFHGEITLNSFHLYLEIGKHGGEFCIPEHMHGDADHLFVVFHGSAQIMIKNENGDEEILEYNKEFPIVEIRAKVWHYLKFSPDFRGACIFSRFNKNGELLPNPMTGRIDPGTVTRNG